MTRIPDIVDEQEAAAALEQEAELLAPSKEAKVPSYHFHAQAMAAEIGEYLDVVTGRMTTIGMPSAAHLERLRDYALQLRCHHLLQLATINAGEAVSPEGFRVAPGSCHCLMGDDSADPWYAEEITVIEVLAGDRARVALTKDVIATVLSCATSPTRTIARREVPVKDLF